MGRNAEEGRSVSLLSETSEAAIPAHLPSVPFATGSSSGPSPFHALASQTHLATHVMHFHVRFYAYHARSSRRTRLHRTKNRSATLDTRIVAIVDFPSHRKHSVNHSSSPVLSEELTNPNPRNHHVGAKGTRWPRLRHWRRIARCRTR